MLRILAAMTLACALVACGGEGGAGGSDEVGRDPKALNNADVAPALENAFSDDRQYDAIVETNLSNCQDGLDSDGPVTVCDVCVVTLRDAVREDGAGVFTVIEAREMRFNTKFWRGISYAQRYTRPANEGDGVWVTAGYQTGLVERWSVELPSALASRLGFQQERERHAIFTSGGVSNVVSSTLRSNAQLRADVLAAVGSCSSGPRVTESGPTEAGPTEIGPLTQEMIAEFAADAAANRSDLNRRSAITRLGQRLTQQFGEGQVQVSEIEGGRVSIRLTDAVDAQELRRVLAERDLILLSHVSNP